MTKQFFTYIILCTACLLASCSSDYFDFNSETDDPNEWLSITISTSDFVVDNGTASRSVDNGSSTTFDLNECVGITILDEAGRLLADNVPYKFNGSTWVFDDKNNEGKQRVYYDGTMSDYIVYYPYEKAADGVTSVSALKELPVFRHTDQKDKEAYRHADLLVWTSTGEALRHLDVKLEHARNSFSLDIKLKWELGLHSEIESDNYLEYHPLRQALIDFKVLDKDSIPIVDDDTNLMYQAEDGTFRYILPDGYDGKVIWRYIYRGESFGGECDVNPDITGVRYVQHTSADISRDKVEQYDYYSSKIINGNIYGFVMPWDAEECFATYPPIGIVIHAGHHHNDMSDYSESGINQKKCRGYVVALTDAFIPDPSNPALPIYKLEWAKKYTEADTAFVTHNNDVNDWSGYDNLIKMREYQKCSKIVDATMFPAAYACETFIGLYGNLAAPLNTSGWFIPTNGMLELVRKDNYPDKGRFNSCFKTIAKYSLHNNDSSDPQNLFGKHNEGYWTSTEFITRNDPENKIIRAEKAYYYREDDSSGPKSDYAEKTSSSYVRPMLAF